MQVSCHSEKIFLPILVNFFYRHYGMFHIIVTDFVTLL